MRYHPRPKKYSQIFRIACIMPFLSNRMQWDVLSDAMLEKGHHVLVDMAYQGFASGNARRDAAVCIHRSLSRPRTALRVKSPCHPTEAVTRRDTIVDAGPQQACGRRPFAHARPVLRQEFWPIRRTRRLTLGCLQG